MLRRIPVLLVVIPLVALVATHAPVRTHATAGPDFVHFESGHVHPIAMTPNHARLLVVETPDARLAVFDVTGGTPVRVAEIPVGLEPVSVTARSDQEAWVVDQLSDDVSVVDLTTLHVKATLHVGDEPADVVFAGAGNSAYVSVAGEDCVKVFDPTNLAAPPTVIPIPGDAPRALARSNDGSQVLVDVFRSSAQTTIVPASKVGANAPAPSPPMSPSLPPAPAVGVIVKRSGVHFLDPTGHNWDAAIPYTMALNEVVYLNTSTNAVAGARGDIATIMTGLAVNPVNGYAAATGTYAIEGEARLEPNLRGHFTEQRLAIVQGLALPRTLVGLNPQVNYSVSPGPQAERDSALGLPTGVTWSPDGQRCFVTSLATDKLGVFDLAGTLRARVPTVAGPTGVLADPTRGTLYVVGRFHEQLQTLSTADFHSIAITPLGFDPTPDPIVNGRRTFYGGFTSGHGEQACASCHLFGDVDGLAWDLGNPTGTFAPPPPGMTDPALVGAHPMKGPMVTQSLRGLAGTGVLHWRGDRTDVLAFNGATVSLLGSAAQLPDTQMAAMSAFIGPLAYPPNPNEALDRTMPDAPVGSPSAARGQTFFATTPVQSGQRCIDCHAGPAGTNGQVISAARIFESQDLKVPQLRNLYTKTGLNDASGAFAKRGFGYLHDGSIDSLIQVLRRPEFDFGSNAAAADANRQDLVAYLMAFDTGMAPAVGVRITWDGTNGGNTTLLARLDTLETQVAAGNCDLVAHGRVGGVPHGWLYLGAHQWRADSHAMAPLTDAQLLSLAGSGSEVTTMAVPAGTGFRSALDRDRDGYLDGDELAAGTDPGDPASHPSSTAVTPGATPVEGVLGVGPNPFRDGTDLRFTLATAAPVNVAVFDLFGREVATLARGESFAAGPHALHWDGRTNGGRPAAVGRYWVKLTSGRLRWTGAIARVR